MFKGILHKSHCSCLCHLNRPDTTMFPFFPYFVIVGPDGFTKDENWMYQKLGITFYRKPHPKADIILNFMDS